jgi:hypothetical protein
MRILLPPGLGDSGWVLAKVKDLVKKHRGGRIDLRMACWDPNGMESRALEYVRRHSFVDSAEMYVMPREGKHGPVVKPGPLNEPETGMNRYMADGPHPELPGIDFMCVPNRPLEEGKRIEEWLPDVEIDWNFAKYMMFTVRELDDSAHVAQNLGRFCVFYMSSLAGNTASGHNRGPIWTPDQWVELGRRLHREFGVTILVVGADYDRDYYDQIIAPMLGDDSSFWVNRIGAWNISMTYAVLRHSKFIVSYQSGIGINGHYLGIPVAIWWRRKRPGCLMEDSINPTTYVAHDEKMVEGWCRPGSIEEGWFKPCIYGRETVDDLVRHVADHGWATHEGLWI